MIRNLLFKISAMILAFVLVIYAIQSLKNVDPDDTMSLLLGDMLKPYNWCPRSTVRVEIYSSEGAKTKTLETAVQIIRVCELLIGGLSAEQIEKANFTKLLVAFDDNGKETVLERADSSELYRVQGMPFRAPNLQRALENLDKK